MQSRGRPWPTWLVACLGTLLLAGCGFHLQGTYDLPRGIDAVYVAYSNAYRVGEPPVVDALEQRLRIIGKLGGPDAQARLVIERVNTERQIMSISAIDGSVAEYKLHAEVVFDYVVAGKTRLDDGRFAVTRFYSNSDTTSLAADAQRHTLLVNMQAQLAERIILRIKRVALRHAGARQGGQP